MIMHRSITGLVLCVLAIGCGNRAERIVVPSTSETARSAAVPGTGLGPRICFFNEFFDYCYPSGGYCVCDSVVVRVDVSAGRTITVNWSAEPQPGLNLRAYRWSLDIEDVLDETPRIDEETDLSHWSRWSLETTSARLGPWTPGERHRFYLDVEDDYGLRSLGIVDFTAVEVANQPPDCTGARAVPGILSPPRQRLVPVGIEGITDPDGDPVTVTVTRVTQDEPVSGLDWVPGGIGVEDLGSVSAADADVEPGLDHRGRGTCPDALLGSGGIALRAERLGRGNGRVYTIWYDATDPHGATCSGTVRVTVPHDRRRAAVDDGQRYDSSGPCRGGGRLGAGDTAPSP